MDDLINRKAAIDALGKCPEAEWEEGWVTTPTGEYKQWLFAYNAILSTPSTCAVPLNKLCEFLADTLHTPAPCFNNEEICPSMDFGNCRLPDAPDVKECWKKILTKWMEGLDAADKR